MMNEPVAEDVQAIERKAVARAFGQASGSYDAAAELQALSRSELLSRLDHFKLQPEVILDLGSGTGLATKELQKRFPAARILSVDLALPMLQKARARADAERPWWRRLQSMISRVDHHQSHYITADAVALPLANASVQLVFSNLMLQWCNPPDRALAEISRVLAPGGLLLCSTFGPLTLQELRAAWAAVDHQPHVNDFIDMHDLGTAMTRAGLAEPVLDVDRLRREYADVKDLLRELKDLGARNSLRDRRRSLTGKERFTAMIAHYQKVFSTSATWEIVYGSAFAPAANTGGLGRGGQAEGLTEVRIPLGAVTRKSRTGQLS